MENIYFHIDVNSAFLSWSALEKLHEKPTENLDLRLVPSIVGGDIKRRHGVVLAKSVPAKAYGIVTGEPIISACKKCPTLLIEPPNHAKYEEYSQQLMLFLSSFCPDIEKLSIDECFMDATSILSRYDSAFIAATIIKDSVFKKFGFTVNIGISDKKVLAKMASDFKKPNLIHTLFQSEIQEKMWPLPVSELYMCGKSSVDTLRRLGLVTIGDLAKSDCSIISANLKSHGLLLWEYANGIDNSLLLCVESEQKGIGNSTTLSNDISRQEDAHKTFLYLAETVGTRLRNQKKVACMISVEIKYHTFHSVSHQMTLDTPCNSTELLYHYARELFKELWDGTPIRLLGLRTSKLLSEDEPIQLSIFDLTPSFETNIPNAQKQKSLDKAIDQIRDKFGQNSIVRGSLLHSSKDYKKH